MVAHGRRRRKKSDRVSLSRLYSSYFSSSIFMQNREETRVTVVKEKKNNKRMSTNMFLSIGAFFLQFEKFAEKQECI
jgi:hypothetical protein